MSLRFMVLAMATTGALIACDSSSNGGPSKGGTTNEQAPPAEVVPSGLARVDPGQVCMVNDQFMGKPQIPVEVEGRTYYGCCPMCKERLAKEIETRTATDPVSGEVVDKASAVIAQDENGHVFYFANEDNLRRYRRP